MKKINCIWWAVILSFAILVAWLLPMFSNGGVTVPVSAASVDYPVQLMNIASKDNAKVLTEVDGYRFFRMFLAVVLDVKPEELDILQDIL